MPTREDVAKQPWEQRLGRMSRTAEDLAAAIRGQSEAVLVRRPDAKNHLDQLRRTLEGKA